MTENKIYKCLNFLADKVGKDFVIAKIYDAWGFDFESEKSIDVLRNSDTLELVLQQFKYKKGEYYNYFKVTSTYRDFEKAVLSDTYTPKKYYEEYEDSRNAYMKYFEETHPGVDYNEWVKEQERLRKERLVKQLSRFVALSAPYREVAKNLFSF